MSDETYTVTSAATGGTFRIQIGAHSSPPLPWYADAETCEAELEKLIVLMQRELCKCDPPWAYGYGITPICNGPFEADENERCGRCEHDRECHGGTE